MRDERPWRHKVTLQNGLPIPANWHILSGHFEVPPYAG